MSAPEAVRAVRQTILMERTGADDKGGKRKKGRGRPKKSSDGGSAEKKLWTAKEDDILRQRQNLRLTVRSLVAAVVRNSRLLRI